MRAEALAAELRTRARCEIGAPIAQLASRLSVDVAAVHLPGVRGAASAEERLIVYSPSGYAPRDEFTIAHELMELHVPAPVAQLGAAVREQFCDRGAAALILPRQQFLFSLHGVGFELPALRRRWPLASWGAIAARLVDLVPRVSACTWVGEHRESWRYDPTLELHHAGAAELAAVEQAQVRGWAVVVRRRLRARAWRLVARQGRRVTLAVVES